MRSLRALALTASAASLAFVTACASTTGAVTADGRVLAAPSPAAPVAATTPAKVYTTPVPADFALTINELSRKCFGSAGCNVTFSVELENVGAHEFDPAKSWRLVYTVTGTEDPYTNNLTITGDRYSYDSEEFTSVKDKSTKLTAAVTSIVPA